MPLIQSPPELPCPQEAPLSPIDRRLTTAEGNGPTNYHTLELNERSVQGLVWTISDAVVAIFVEWHRDTLFYGGAWFEAPANWPTMDGLVVRKRRFIDAPRFTYLGAGMHRVEINAELRGEVVAEPLVCSIGPPAAIDPGEPGLLFLDNFAGGNDSSIDGRVPAIGAAWEPTSDEPAHSIINGALSANDIADVLAAPVSAEPGTLHVLGASFAAFGRVRETDSITLSLLGLDGAVIQIIFNVSIGIAQITGQWVFGEFGTQSPPAPFAAPLQFCGWNHVRIECGSDGSVALFINGAEVWSDSDAAFYLTEGTLVRVATINEDPSTLRMGPVYYEAT